MAEYVIVGFTLVAIASAGAARLWRHHIRKDSEINQIIPLPESVNEINIIRKSKKAWIIKNTKGRKIYALVKSDSTWHLQTAFGQTLSTFKTDKNNNPDALVSESGHAWNRCALTFLPIVSTNVKVDPVTQKRIIDISKDELNEYGYFTRTILETLNKVSIYSGCRFGSKP